MKTLLMFVLLLIISSFNIVSAQYIEWQENKIQEDGIMTITTMSVIDEPRICTMDYTPVCAEVQVQCIKAPCPAVTQTFGNACSAWDNKILFQGACSSYMNDSLYKKLDPKREAVQNIISKLSTKTLVKMNVMLDQKIEMTKMSRIAVEMQKERITTYAFIKSIVNSQLSTK
jgi:hypothetical protein